MRPEGHSSLVHSIKSSVSFGNAELFYLSSAERCINQFFNQDLISYDSDPSSGKISHLYHPV